MTATVAMTWCNPLRPFPIMESALNVEAAEQVFKTSMRKIETGRRTRGGIQLEKSLMIAMIALKARRYIWEEHVLSVQRTETQTFVNCPINDMSGTEPSPLLLEDDSDDLEEEDESFEQEECDNTESSSGRKRPSSSSSDSESESDEEFDSEFTSSSPQKRYRMDALSTLPVNSEEEFSNPAMCQLVTSFDNLLSSDPGSILDLSDNVSCTLTDDCDDLSITELYVTPQYSVVVSGDSCSSRESCIR